MIWYNKPMLEEEVHINVGYGLSVLRNQPARVLDNLAFFSFLENKEVMMTAWMISGCCCSSGIKGLDTMTKEEAEARTNSQN